MVSPDFIKEVSEIKIPYSSKMFYVWLYSKFGYDSFTIKSMIGYGKSKRTIMRYLSVLKNKGMVKTVVEKKPVNRYVIK